jgi:hypothetical protein
VGGQETVRDPAEAYEGLRSQALEAESSGLIPVEGTTGEIAGLVVDIPAGKDAFATLVALRDGTSSLYLSTGGGIIGAGFHEPVRAAVDAVLNKVVEHVPGWTLDEDTRHPPADLVKFFALTSAGRRVNEVPEAAFWGRERHELTPLIAAVQALISAVRSVAPE